MEDIKKSGGKRMLGGKPITSSVAPSACEARKNTTDGTTGMRTVEPTVCDAQCSGIKEWQ